jgi:hypothetical protein
MHRIHNMYLKSIQDKKMCDKYIDDLFTCYMKDYTIQKENEILNKMNLFCNQNYSSFSNKAICSSVSSCGDTLK